MLSLPGMIAADNIRFRSFDNRIIFSNLVLTDNFSESAAIWKDPVILLKETLNPLHRTILLKTFTGIVTGGANVAALAPSAVLIHLTGIKKVWTRRIRGILPIIITELYC